MLIREYLHHCGYSHHLLARIKRSEQGILLNGEGVPVSRPLHTDDQLSIYLEEEVPSEHIPAAPVPFSIVYEDEDLLVVNKPSDTPIHPSFHNHENTLANGIVHYYEQQGIPFVYRCINRLDRDTSGLLVIAKNALSSSILSTAIKQQTLSSAESPFLIHRTYLAIVEGKLETPGIVTAPIGRKPGSVIERCVDFANGEPAITHYQPLHYRSDLNLSLVSLQLETGRTHQIRVHMGYLGYPLIGDYLYYPKKDQISRQALHSWKLSFHHPITKEYLEFQAPLPDDMQFILETGNSFSAVSLNS